MLSFIQGCKKKLFFYLTLKGFYNIFWRLLKKVGVLTTKQSYIKRFFIKLILSKVKKSLYEALF